MMIGKRKKKEEYALFYDTLFEKASHLVRIARPLVPSVVDVIKAATAVNTTICHTPLAAT